MICGNRWSRSWSVGIGDLDHDLPGVKQIYRYLMINCPYITMTICHLLSLVPAASWVLSAPSPDKSPPRFLGGSARTGEKGSSDTRRTSRCVADASRTLAMPKRGGMVEVWRWGWVACFKRSYVCFSSARMLLFLQPFWSSCITLFRTPVGFFFFFFCLFCCYFSYFSGLAYFVVFSYQVS